MSSLVFCYALRKLEAEIETNAACCYRCRSAAAKLELRASNPEISLVARHHVWDLNLLVVCGCSTTSVVSVDPDSVVVYR